MYEEVIKKMEITINEAIELLERGSQFNYYDSAEDFCKAYDMAIDIMRKYQKICKIVKHWVDADLASESPSFADTDTIEEIIEVLEQE